MLNLLATASKMRLDLELEDDRGREPFGGDGEADEGDNDDCCPAVNPEGRVFLECGAEKSASAPWLGAVAGIEGSAPEFVTWGLCLLNWSTGLDLGAFGFRRMYRSPGIWCISWGWKNV